jgi:hypothetical protein
MSRRPGYGLEYDIEQVMRAHFGIADPEGDGEAWFSDSEFGEATDELIKALQDKGYISKDAA